uniref:Uncharacterized protein n=1 Tax=Anguilla anguilla TaxID=7936 RepID=A0A0E9PZQ7_ANGAN
MLKSLDSFADFSLLYELAELRGSLVF